MASDRARTVPSARDNDALRKYLAEFIGTFVLVLGGVGAVVIAGDNLGFLGVSFAFGLALLAMVYAVGPISGCHVNPAVTLALLLAGKIERRHVPGYILAQCLGALLAAWIVLLLAQGGWALEQLWLFIVAPLLGGGLAAALYRTVRRPKEPLTAAQAERALESARAERLAHRRPAEPTP